MAFSIISRPTGGSGAMGTSPIDPEVALAKQKILGATEGRAQELANDPYQKSVMDYLQGVVGGQNVPYTDTVKNSILAQQNRGFADAEAAQMEALRQSLGASGQSIYDPGYQAAQREAMSKRQGQNLDAMGQMEMKANLANHQARMGGAGALADARGAQNAQINQMGLAGAGYRAKTTAAVPNGMPQKPRPGMSPYDITQGVSSQNHAAFRM